MKFKELQAFINDFAGFVTLICGLVLLFMRDPHWVYLVIVGMGLVAITGKKITDLMSISGMGGGNGNGHKRDNGREF